MKTTNFLLHAFGALAAVAFVAFLLVGCSHFDAPTASQPSTSDMGMWNPAGPGALPGYNVPIVDPGYWEPHAGSVINPAQTVVSAIIGPNGGSLRLGPHSLVVPAGAVREPITFSLTVASRTSIALDCGPSPFRFDVPVTLTLSYAGTSFTSAANPSNIEILYMAADGSLEEIPGTVDVRGASVTAQVSHFSRYILGSPVGLSTY
jgi:hypothetical protein